MILSSWSFVPCVYTYIFVVLVVCTIKICHHTLFHYLWFIVLIYFICFNWCASVFLVFVFLGCWKIVPGSSLHPYFYSLNFLYFCKIILQTVPELWTLCTTHNYDGPHKTHYIKNLNYLQWFVTTNRHYFAACIRTLCVCSGSSVSLMYFIHGKVHGILYAILTVYFILYKWHELQTKFDFWTDLRTKLICNLGTDLCQSPLCFHQILVIILIIISAVL